MRAVIVDEDGAALRLAVVPRPSPGPGQVLVRIAASGTNPLDVKIRMGAAPHARHPLPAVLGIDLAGTVETVGEGITSLRVGDEVYGMAGGVGGYQGTLAEYAAVDAALLARKPVNLTFRQAAALPLVFITAWEGLVDRAGVRAGQTVLVQGGAGGVGQMVIQLALARGAAAFAVGAPEGRLAVERLGATFVERSEPVGDYVTRLSGGKGFDLVYDTAGGAALDASFLAVRRFGHVVSCLGWGTHALAPLSFRAASYSGVFTLLPLLTGDGRAHHGEILAEAARMADSGKLVPPLSAQRFTLESVGEAHRLIAGGTARGKLVVDVAGDSKEAVLPDDDGAAALR
uniref:zinc-dependent alcohol dehydrogenase family protein n=1 Tax=Elioraea rosea TaxID=2492390 RepID=UPI0038CF9577